MHSWRSDTEAAIRKRREENHAMEMKAKNDELASLQNSDSDVQDKDAQIRNKEDQIEALTWENRRRDTDVNRLEAENEELRQAAKVHEDDLKVHVRRNDAHDELAAKIVLLQELQKRTKTQNSRDIAAYRQQIETHRAETESLHAQLRDKEMASQMAHVERGSLIDAMHTKLEQQLKHEIELMNSSMAELQQKYKAQEDELNALRQNASITATHEVPLAEQIRELKANLESVEWEKARQQEELVLTRGSARRLEDTREALALKNHELAAVQVHLLL